MRLCGWAQLTLCAYSRDFRRPDTFKNKNGVCVVAPLDVGAFAA